MDDPKTNILPFL